MTRDIVLSPRPIPRSGGRFDELAESARSRAKHKAVFGTEPLAWMPGRIDAFRDAVAEREIALLLAGDDTERARCRAALACLDRVVEHAARDFYEAGLTEFAAALVSGVPPWGREPPARDEPPAEPTPAEDVLLDDGSSPGWPRR